MFLPISGYVRFWENDFWDGWNFNLSVDYERAMCQERVGENGLNFMPEMVKTERRKKKRRRNCVVRRARPRTYSLFFFARSCVYTLPILARSCAFTARSCVLSGLRFRVFCAFSPISVLNWPLVYTWKF